MADAKAIIAEIYTFLDKCLLKKSKCRQEDVIHFIEEKWRAADEEKYVLHDGCIVIGRMIREYIEKKDFANMMRWLAQDDLHASSKKNPAYIHNYYKGQCCLECGNEAEALKYFQLCYAEEPDYIFTRAPFCYEFFNQHLDEPRQLEQVVLEELATFPLQEFLSFFQEENGELYYEIVKSNGDYGQRLNKKHKNGLAYLQARQMDIVKNILTALLQKYPALQEKYHYSEEDKKIFMPDVTEIEGFADLLSPTAFYVLSVYRDELPYIGFSFFCSWEQEHGLGVMTHRNQVIALGDADMAFAVDVAKNDLKQHKEVRA